MKFIAWLMSTFAVIMPLIFAQPTNVPETRVSPYGDEMPPDQYGVWPTDEFETAEAPWWLPTYALRPLYSARCLLLSGTKNNSLLVLHKGKIVHEWYADGYDEDVLQRQYSATKSVTSALVGIAIADGFISGVDAKVIDFFPDADLRVFAEQKKEITIEQLLTMTSGLAGDFDEAFPPLSELMHEGETEEEFDQRAKEDLMRFFFECINMVAEPGERWNYSTAGVDVLLGVVAAAIDRPLEEYVEEKLFRPMGITDYMWITMAKDSIFRGGTGLRLTARDMAKFGYLYLNYGRWEDQQLIPADWVAQSSSASNLPFGYGRLFWNVPFGPKGSYEAQGGLGQFIEIFPDQDLVIVRTGTSLLAA